MFRFEKLEIWQLAIEYCLEIYSLTNKFPKQEQFGLVAQLKRAAVSISSNIAEGSGGTTTKDFINFLNIAIKSTLETVSQLLFCEKAGFLSKEKREHLYNKAEILIKKINAFKKSLR